MFSALSIFLFLLNRLLCANAQLSQQSCPPGSAVCNPRSSCCPSGTYCNFNAAIPVCQSADSPVISGWDDDLPCGGNPYLFDCARVLNIAGFCCPRGTICFAMRGDPQKVVSCVDAIGTTSAAVPSATSVSFAPTISAIPKNEASLSLNPQQAWNSTHVTASTCGSSEVLHTANAVNATVSFSYSGPSFLISAQSSELGGVFSVIIDGTEIKDTIDTFSASGGGCILRAFPPFRLPGVPGFGSRNDHTISLVHRGPSPLAPNGTVSSTVQFYSVAIPQFNKNGTFKVTIGIGGLLWVPIIVMLLYIVR